MINKTEWIGAHFQDLGEVYDDTIPSHIVEYYLRKRLRFVRELGGDIQLILNVGCGTGALDVHLQEAGFRVIGMDKFAGMLKRARARRIPVVCSHSDALPFPDGRFDLAMCVAVMHHVAEADAIRALMHEMVRVTRPGGHILIWDHNPNNPYWPMFMKRLPQDAGDERLISLGEFLENFRTIGVSRVSFVRKGWIPDFLPRPLLGIAAVAERVLEHVPLVKEISAHNIVVAVK